MNRIAKVRIVDDIQAKEPTVFVDHDGIVTVGVLLVLNGVAHTVFAEISDEVLKNWNHQARIRSFNPEEVAA